MLCLSELLLIPGMQKMLFVTVMAINSMDTLFVLNFHARQITASVEVVQLPGSVAAVVHRAVLIIVFLLLISHHLEVGKI